jgi:hypothetical protein
MVLKMIGLNRYRRIIHIPSNGNDEEAEMMRVLNMIGLVVLVLFAACGCSSMRTRNESQQVMIEQSRSHEDCMELTPTDMLHYSFKTSRPVNFNIHYHEEGKVTYVVSKDNTVSEEGMFSPEKKQYYCLMWTNLLPETVSLSYNYKVDKK